MTSDAADQVQEILFIYFFSFCALGKHQSVGRSKPTVDPGSHVFRDISYTREPTHQIDKFSFEIKSNPLGGYMGNHSVGKWDPIPKCDKMRNTSVRLNRMPFVFHCRRKPLPPGSLLVNILMFCHTAFASHSEVHSAFECEWLTCICKKPQKTIE